MTKTTGSLWEEMRLQTSFLHCCLHRGDKAMPSALFREYDQKWVEINSHILYAGLVTEFM